MCLFSVIFLIYLILASSDKNYDGIEFGNTTNHAGSSSSAPGTMMKIENGMNLMKSDLTYLSLMFSL